MKKKITYHGTHLLLCVLILCVLSLTSCFDAGKQEEESGGKSAAEQVLAQNDGDPWAKDTAGVPHDTVDEPVSTEPVQTDAVIVDTKPAEPAETEIADAPDTEPAEEVTEEPAETEEETPIEGESVGFASEEVGGGEEYVLQAEPEDVVITLPAEGTVSSKQSKNLVLNADYTVSDNGDGTWGVHVLLRLSCYEIYAGERLESGKLYLCGDVHTFSTHELSNTERSLHNFNFYEADAVVPAGSEINLAANWTFNGTYGKTYIGDLTLAASLYIE